MELGVIALVTLLAALIGGTIAWLIELWREVIAAIGAARVVRLELVANVTKCEVAKNHRGDFRSMPELDDASWRTLSPQFARLIDEQELADIARTYAFVFQARAAMEVLYRTGPDANSESTLSNWSEELRASRSVLRTFEMTGRLRLMARAILGSKLMHAH